MRNARGLTGGVRGEAGSATQVPRCPHRVSSCCPRLGHRNLFSSPCPNVLDRLTGSRIIGLYRLEVSEDVLGTSRRPQREQPMVDFGECPAATDRP